MKVIKKLLLSTVISLVLFSSFSVAVSAEAGEIIEIVDEDSAEALFPDSVNTPPPVIVNAEKEPVVIDDEPSALGEAPGDGENPVTADRNELPQILIVLIFSLVIATLTVKNITNKVDET